MRTMHKQHCLVMTFLVCLCWNVSCLQAQVAVRGETVYTMAGDPIVDGMVLIKNGKIAAVGKAGDLEIPTGYEVLRAKVVTPGLVDAHTVVGLAGYYNYDHDQDQLERSQPIQPQLRAIDAYNPREALVGWVRSLGVTTIHTGHGPGELISGQTMVAKTTGNSVEDAVLVPTAMVACTLTAAAQKSGTKSPGTRAKMMGMLREKFIKAKEYQQKRQDEEQPRDLQLDALVEVLQQKVPLLVTADRAQDIASALRLAKEFNFKLILDSAAESHQMIEEIKAAGVPVIVHPTMARATGSRENASFQTARRLSDAGIPIAMQSGYEGYVPKTRVVLFEAAMAAAHGLGRQRALEACTIGPARILGIEQRVGSLEVGKDGDVALYDGDPFEYDTHCIGVVIDGNVVSRITR